MGVNLRVLVWGPGRKALSEWYEKRVNVAQAIKDSDPHFEVLTSEELFDEDPAEDRYNIEAAQLELLHAWEAHLIIALVIGPPDKQGGVYRELDVISQYRALRDKTWIFLPAKERVP